MCDFFFFLTTNLLSPNAINKTAKKLSIYKEKETNASVKIYKIYNKIFLQDASKQNTSHDEKYV